MIGNGYELTKAFYAEVESNEAMQIGCKSHHHSLYTWICELRNRTGREVLDLPVIYTLQMSFIGSAHTLASAIDDLEKWRIIDVITKTKGQGTKVRLAIAFMQKHCNGPIAEMQLLCNSTAITVQTTKTSKSNKTSKHKQDEVDGLLSTFKHQSVAFRQAWSEWVQYRTECKKPLTPTTIRQQLLMLDQQSEADAITTIQTSVRNSWHGLFPPKGANNNSYHSNGFSFSKGVPD